MLADLRTTLRSLKTHPGFALVVILTLALGLGAGSAVFSVANAVLLRPLPFAEVDRVVVLGEVSRASDARMVAPVTFDDWRTRQRPFAEIAAFRYWETVNLEDATGDLDDAADARISVLHTPVLRIRHAEAVDDEGVKMRTGRQRTRLQRPDAVVQTTHLLFGAVRLPVSSHADR